MRPPRLFSQLLLTVLQCSFDEGLLHGAHQTETGETQSSCGGVRQRQFSTILQSLCTHLFIDWYGTLHSFTPVVALRFPVFKLIKQQPMVPGRRPLWRSICHAHFMYMPLTATMQPSALTAWQLHLPTAHERTARQQRAGMCRSIPQGLLLRHQLITNHVSNLAEGKLLHISK